MLEASKRHVGKSVCMFGVAGASVPSLGRKLPREGVFQTEEGVGGLKEGLEVCFVFIRNEEAVDAERFRKKRESR